MDSKFTINVPSQLGDLVLDFDHGKLTALSISGNKSGSNKNTVSENLKKSEQVEYIQQQLKNYFSAATPITSRALMPAGTAFQKSVWNELCKIPVGETRTYGEIANKLNSSARAVGNACRKNPIAIIVPCHRVVSATGLGGYAGKTEGRQLDIKRWLLNHEGIFL
jgi:methylated-DNA-[protein]-cysteine S-methyltransferase